MIPMVAIVWFERMNVYRLFPDRVVGEGGEHPGESDACDGPVP